MDKQDKGNIKSLKEYYDKELRSQMILDAIRIIVRPLKDIEKQRDRVEKMRYTLAYALGPLNHFLFIWRYFCQKKHWIKMPDGSWLNDE